MFCIKLCQNHFAVEKVFVSCTPKLLYVLNDFQQVKKTKDLESLSSFSFGLTQLEEEERNGFCELYSITILLWKWFLWVVLQNHFVVEMVSSKNNMNNIFQQFIFWAFTTNPSNTFPANNHQNHNTLQISNSSLLSIFWFPNSTPNNNNQSANQLSHQLPFFTSVSEQQATRI